MFSPSYHLPYPVSDVATVKYSVILAGGRDSDSQAINKVLLYNIKTQKSHMFPDMKCNRAGCVAAVVKDNVIVIGGNDKRGDDIKSVECFRFDRYTWEELPKCMWQDLTLLRLYVNYVL